MQDGDTKVDLGAGKHTLAASCAGIIKKCNNDNALRYIFFALVKLRSFQLDFNLSVLKF